MEALTMVHTQKQRIHRTRGGAFQTQIKNYLKIRDGILKRGL